MIAISSIYNFFQVFYNMFIHEIRIPLADLKNVLEAAVEELKKNQRYLFKDNSSREKEVSEVLF